ncbi:hypothetical protein [Noviherbaspirillum galbum]|uniref:Molecular chaperone DnaJ n=1 Tax=Noviherbaspirillum galbum TaxID=2709383 RepID=A0A6B3SQ90_9BURK|nr:hypothetical protein [Noviherbaspirillum galbum]NEX62923.1 hypothetical protein [Noviherbaspirillum galbum]
MASNAHPTPQKTERATELLHPGDEAAPGTPQTGEVTCPECDGQGNLAGKTCPNCGGTGMVVVTVGDA